MLKLNSAEWGYMLERRNSQKLPDSLRTGDQLQFPGSGYGSRNQLGKMVYYYERTAQKDPKMRGMTGYNFLSELHDPATALRWFEA